jgi:serine/threonine protein kinase
MPTVTLRPIAEEICRRDGLTFVRPVGSGQFKETFEVRMTADRRLALKILVPGGSSPERAQREIDAMLECEHPHIAKLERVAGTSISGTLYQYMLEEFLDGGTLADQVRGGGQLDAVSLRRVGVQLVEAVCHIASRGLVHRDIKPENVMLRADGNIVVVDFGIVRDLSASSLTQTWANQGPGTPLYAPPEQLRNDKALIDWRADQFSVGVTLAFCGFGAHPYAMPGASPAETVQRVRDRQPVADAFRASAMGAGLPMLITMVQPWPVHRYRTPDDLGSAWARP